jgi:hypothetical protein
MLNKLKRLEYKLHNTILITLLFLASCGYFMEASMVLMYGFSAGRVTAIMICLVYMILFICANSNPAEWIEMEFQKVEDV